MLIDTKNILLVVIAAVNLFLGVIVFLKSRRDKINLIYSFNILAIIAWTLTMFFYRSSGDENSLLWAKLLYIAPTLIASSFLYFTYIFPNKEKPASFLKSFLIFFGNFIIILAILAPDIVIESVNLRAGFEKEIIFGGGYVFYAAYTLFYFCFAFWRLFKKYLKSRGIEKKQIIYLLSGYMLAANLAFVTNLIMPWIGKFELNWIGQVFTVFMVIFAVYAISKHHLFNLKVIATEIFAGGIVLVLLINFLTSEVYSEWIIRGFVLALGSIFSYLIIRSVLKEVRMRVEVEGLAKNLESANAKLKKLDQVKTEFLSIASHQLRSPLTAIKGYSSMLLEGSFGKIEGKVKEASEKIFQSSNRMIDMVSDFLDVSRIELGKMEYEFTEFDIKELAKNITEEFKVNNRNNEIKLSFEAVENSGIKINADYNKIRQVVLNVINNALKYTRKGFVKVSVSANPSLKTVLISVKDSGVGMNDETMHHIFKKFSRAKDASKSHTDGSGLGLYVASEMVKAHKGRIWAESDGEGKGSSFFVELPI